MDRPQLSCIIVDDEPAAIRILESYCVKHGGIKVLDNFRNPIEALSFLNSATVDFILLDINMPQLSGIEFLKSLTETPRTILTTAYSDYALESYDYDVVDYLLKPIRFPRFVKAINKLSQPKATVPDLGTPLSPITLKDGPNLYRVDPLDIQYVEAFGNYIKIHTSSNTLIINSGLQEFLDQHNWEHLQRVHKSYAVNSNKVSKLSYYHLWLNGTEIPIGRTYRTAFKKTFETKS